MQETERRVWKLQSMSLLLLLHFTGDLEDFVWLKDRSPPWGSLFTQCGFSPECLMQRNPVRWEGFMLRQKKTVFTCHVLANQTTCYCLCLQMLEETNWLFHVFNEFNPSFDAIQYLIYNTDELTTLSRVLCDYVLHGYIFIYLFACLLACRD